MSKVGRKPVPVGGVSVEIKGQDIHYKGKKTSGVYTVPSSLQITLEDGAILLTLHPESKKTEKIKDLNRIWGLHRALLFNKITGSDVEFEKKINIIGLGYKAVLSGKKVTMTLGYSHKIDFDLPEKVSLEIDKSGQNLTFKSSDKELVGKVCSTVRSFRPPEPYKGTGVKLATEVIARKAGKTKA